MQLCYTDSSPICRFWLISLASATTLDGYLVFTSERDTSFQIWLDRRIVSREAFYIFILELRAQLLQV